jgi:hypothetical protein
VTEELPAETVGACGAAGFEKTKTDGFTLDITEMPDWSLANTDTVYETPWPSPEMRQVLVGSATSQVFPDGSAMAK